VVGAQTVFPHNTAHRGGGLRSCRALWPRRDPDIPRARATVHANLHAAAPRESGDAVCVERRKKNDQRRPVAARERVPTPLDHTTVYRPMTGQQRSTVQIASSAHTKKKKIHKKVAPAASLLPRRPVRQIRRARCRVSTSHASRHIRSEPQRAPSSGARYCHQPTRHSCRLGAATRRTALISPWPTAAVHHAVGLVRHRASRGRSSKSGTALALGLDAAARAAVPILRGVHHHVLFALVRHHLAARRQRSSSSCVGAARGEVPCS
jgi:hypothetical protein